MFVCEHVCLCVSVSAYSQVCVCVCVCVCTPTYSSSSLARALSSLSLELLLLFLVLYHHLSETSNVLVCLLQKIGETFILLLVNHFTIALFIFSLRETEIDRLAITHTHVHVHKGMQNLEGFYTCIHVCT